ncbi:hypothetical protein DXA97_16025 [Clostridium sp. OF09-36]|nr:hypothetical protein DXA97_16025 [Clostridium sp. OF09-36]
MFAAITDFTVSTVPRNAPTKAPASADSNTVPLPFEVITGYCTSTFSTEISRDGASVSFLPHPISLRHGHLQ